MQTACASSSRGSSTKDFSSGRQEARSGGTPARAAAERASNGPKARASRCFSYAGAVAEAAAALLKRSPVFSGLSDASLADVAGAARSREVPAGGMLFREGDPAETFFIVSTGSFKLTQVDAAGHQVLLRLAGPGDAVGGAGVIGEDTYPVTAEALGSAAVLEWSGETFAALLERHPPLAINMLKFVAGRLHTLQVQFRQVATERVEQRVARALLRLVQQSGKRVPEGVLIDVPLSREDIAQMTGTTVFTVSRILSRWEAEGLVDSGRQRIVVRRPHGLVAVAEELREGR